jgi:hypothetical protein
MSAATRARVTLLGGQFAYFLGRLAFNVSDFRSARRFTALAGTYAGEVGEPVLTLSVATLHSSVAYHTQRYGPAVDALRAVRHVHHPYMNARVAAYLARALAKQGDHVGARAALDQMEATACTMAPMPGETPVGPAAVAMFRAGIGVTLGDTSMAREWAPVAVEGYRRGGGDYTVEESQHADVTIALTHLGSRAAEPEEAARIALGVLVSRPTHTVMTRLRQVAGAFTPGHQQLPEVVALVEEVRALPTGTLS